MHFCIRMSAWTGSLRTAALREAFDGLQIYQSRLKKMVSGDLGDQDTLSVSGDFLKYPTLWFQSRAREQAHGQEYVGNYSFKN